MMRTVLRSLIILIMMIWGPMAIAANLEDVQVLDVLPGENNYEIKMQVRYENRDVQFSVDIVKEDKEAFSKLGLILKKIAKPQDHRIDLKIPSFSYAQNGSYYNSQSVQFSELTPRAPNSAVKNKKNKTKK